MLLNYIGRVNVKSRGYTCFLLSSVFVLLLNSFMGINHHVQ